MSAELNAFRTRFGHLLVWLMWAHVPVLGLVAAATGVVSVLTAMLTGAAMAAVYQITWRRHGIAPVTRYVSAIMLVGEPAMLLIVLQGHPWQMDMHMYFFAMLALNIAWFDRGALLVAASATALHHLVLLYFVPYAVFSTEGNLARVALHAVIVAFQTAVLVWVSDKVVATFAQISRMSDVIVLKGGALEARTREAEEASRTKSMFLATMSHEIRTPINAILGFCHLIQRTALEPRQLDYIVKINGAGVSLLRLINDILDFSKNEAGKLTLEAQEFDPRAAISCQVQLVAESLRARNLRISLCIDENLPALLIGDEMRLNQVLLNLLSNAIKFSTDGAIVISAKMVEQANGIAAIECSVRDDGIGMTDDELGRLFTSFTQADSSTTRRFGGTGLGLAISRQIVEQMGGWIRAESAPEQGSVFTFRVLMGIGDALKAHSAERLAAVKRLRVLVADDNPIARQILEETFMRWGMAVDVVASGSEALSLIAARDRAGVPYDVFMIDWKMPEKDGLETLREMRANTGLTDMPMTVVMTAYGINDAMNEAQGDHINHFLSKPINAHDLLDVLNQVQPLRSNAASEIMQPALQLSPDLHGLRVLLAEDNEINREIALELLTDAGLRVDCAQDGVIACRMVAEHGADYAAVLMDVQMPEMDGLTATRKIRMSYLATELPIIAMTAHAYPEERERCFDAGMNDHIPKPVDPSLLLAVLTRWLRRAPSVPPAQTTAQTPMRPPETSPETSDLPSDLAPFDIATALRRVNGKSALLRRLIVSFGQSYPNFRTDIEALLGAGRFDDAHRLAHTLKGVAGSLELPETAALADKVEHRLAHRDLGGLSALLDELDDALKPAVAAARTLGVPPVLVAQSAAPPPPVINAQIAPLVEALHQQIRRRSLSARSGFVALADAAGLHGVACTNHPIGLALKQLDYAAAETLLAESFPLSGANDRGLTG